MEAFKKSLLLYVWHDSTKFFELQGNLDAFRDEIELGMTTSFNYSIHDDFHGNRADFHDMNDNSKSSEGKSFQYIY